VSQSRRQSLIEAWANILVGIALNTALNFIVFPRFGWHINAQQNAALVVIYTGTSLARGYGLRRIFNRVHSTSI
jgi:O-antigen/teichoic acid export membrane protein